MKSAVGGRYTNGTQTQGTDPRERMACFYDTLDKGPVNPNREIMDNTERDYADAGFDPESGLLLRERAFADHYLSTLNARQAYTAAGYTATSPQNALKNATDMLNRPPIKEWVNLKFQQRMDALGVRADNVLAELVIVATASVTMFQVNPNTGRVEVVPGVAVEYLKAISWWHSRSTTKTRTVDGANETTVIWDTEFKLHDKLKACQLLCNHLGLTETELPPLEVLLNRLPPRYGKILREILANPDMSRPAPIMDAPPLPDVAQPGA